MFKPSTGEINGERYSFKPKGFLNQEIAIIEYDSGSIVGKIKYNSWKTQATIKMSDRVFIWKHTNSWQTKWRIRSSDGVQIDYHGSYSKGRIESDTINELLILTGLYIKNSF